MKLSRSHRQILAAVKMHRWKTEHRTIDDDWRVKLFVDGIEVHGDFFNEAVLEIHSIMKSHPTLSIVDAVEAYRVIRRLTGS